MKIRKISPPYLYAAHYRNDTLNIYRLTYKKLTDMEYLSDFFDRFKNNLTRSVWIYWGFVYVPCGAKCNDEMVTAGYTDGFFVVW